MSSELSIIKPENKESNGKRTQYRVYSDELADQIANTVRNTMKTIQEICTQYGMSKTTFYSWNRDIPYFKNAISKARNDRTLEFDMLADKGLEFRLTGGYVSEQVTVYGDKDGKPYIKEQRITKKYILPDPKLIMFQKLAAHPEIYGGQGSEEIPTEIILEFQEGNSDEQAPEELPPNND